MCILNSKVNIHGTIISSCPLHFPITTPFLLLDATSILTSVLFVPLLFLLLYHQCMNT